MGPALINYLLFEPMSGGELCRVELTRLAERMYGGQVKKVIINFEPLQFIEGSNPKTLFEWALLLSIYFYLNHCPVANFAV